MSAGPSRRHVAFVLALSACATEPSGGRDTGDSAGPSALDAGLASPDAGSGGSDAAPAPLDAGRGDAAAASDAGVSDAGRDDACPEARPLACGDTVRFDTAEGSRRFERYACASPSLSFPGREVIFALVSETAGTARLDLRRLGGSTRTFPMFALEADGRACTEALACVVPASSGVGDAQALELPVAAGGRVYVAVDLAGDFAIDDSAEFELSVGCLASACGDGAIGPGEACDDGDRDDGDGCSADCRIEPEHSCAGEPSVCRRHECGNGVIDPGEGCDTGVPGGGPGCSAACRIEPGWGCVGAPSVCTRGGDACADATPLTPGSPVRRTTEGLADDLGVYRGACGVGATRDAGPDAVFSIEVPPGQLLEAWLTDAFSGSRLALLEDCAQAEASCLRQGEVSWANVGAAPVTRYLVVDGIAASHAGAYTLESRLTPVADLMAGDACTTAERVASLPASIPGRTTGATNLYDGYAGACTDSFGFRRFGHGPDRAYVVSVPAGATLRASVAASGGWDEVVVIASACGALIDDCLDYSDPGTARATNTGAAARDFYVIVDGFWSYAHGDFTLSLALE